MLNIAAICSANTIAEEVLRGIDLHLTDACPNDGCSGPPENPAPISNDSSNAEIISSKAIIPTTEGPPISFKITPISPTKVAVSYSSPVPLI